MIRALIYLCFIALLTSCSAFKKQPTARFKKLSFNEMHTWSIDHHAWAFESFKNSCDKLMNIEAENDVAKTTSVGGSAIDWQVPCLEALSMYEVDHVQARLFFERWFTPYQVLDEDFKDEGNLTGYYQIELNGSKKRDSIYKYPVYKKPYNLDDIKGSSQINHSSINGGALKNKGLEIAWVDNRAKLYLMHIQGSGVIKMREGGEYYLGFDGHNGYRFKGISEAVRNRDMKFSSYQEMINWLHLNPKECLDIINEDPSYVFFKNTDYQYAMGGQGVELRAERSIAIDHTMYPYGTPVWIEADLNATAAFEERKYNRLFIAQDTGSAIRGAIRGDIFFGKGKIAEDVAMNFKTKGKFIVLFPKTVEMTKNT